MVPQPPVAEPSPLEPVTRVRRRHRRRRKWWSPRWLWSNRPGNSRPPLARSSRRRKRVALSVLGAVAGLVVVGGVWTWVDLRNVGAEVGAARDRLDSASHASAMATPESRTASREAIGVAQTKLAAARRRVARSPAISVAQFLPVLRDQRQGLLELLDDSSRGTATAANLLDRVQSLAAGAQMRDGTVPLDGLQALATDTARAGTVFRGITLSRTGLWGPLGDLRRRLDEVAATAHTQLTQASEALTAARSFLGGEGDRRYLLAMQNNAEMRDQGMVLSYAVVHCDGGRIEIERQGPIDDLRLDAPTAVQIPPGTEEVFGSTEPTLLWQSVNATADFDWSARVMAEMYRQATGSAIDGVVALDVPGLASLLHVVGPLDVPGLATPISAGNAGKVLLNDLYRDLTEGDDQGPRKEALAAVAKAAIERLTTGNQDVVGVGTALAEASAGGHLRLWSAMATEQQAFVRVGLSGGPATIEADRTFHLAVENRTGTKLDYFVKPSARQEVRFTGGNDVLVHTTVVIDNQAPVGQAPSYQLGPDESSLNPGDYTAWVLLWGPAGATQPESTSESGLTLTQSVLTVAPGERKEVVFDTLIHDAVRDGRLGLRLVPQPRLEPMDLSVTLDPGGHRVEGATSWHGPWDRSRRMTWDVAS